jgi:large subunit ribosomal protein L10
MSVERKTETIPEWKREEVDAVADLLERYDSVGVVDITGIPSTQLQDMRRNLHGTAELRVSRNTLLVRALEDVDDGLEHLTEYVTGQVGLLGTDENPFSLFQQLEASKTSAPINAGEVAPNDILITEGDTGIDPGPFVGELQSVGANARIDEGSIKVLEDSTVLSAGETVSAELSNVLAELGIEPKEVGLDLRAVFADDVVFEPADLALDVDEYRADVSTAAARGRNLSINAGYPTAATVGSMLAKASGEAKNLAIHASIVDADIMPDLLGKADSQVRTLAAQIDDPDALPEELQAAAEEAEAEPSQADADDDEQDDEPSDEAEASDTADADDDDDEEDGGAALGDMFG